MAEREYQRLTRPRSRRKGLLTFVIFVKRSSLWLGKDHLLNVDSSFFAEEYKRFYFRDIQAIIIRRTERRKIWNFVLTLVVLLSFAPAARQLPDLSSDSFLSVVIAIWFSILALGLLANNLLGSSCTVHLRTAVQIEELPSLNRIRRTRKVLDRVRPLIVAVQGRLAPEEVSARMSEMMSR
jgi:hypothetical protein